MFYSEEAWLEMMDDAYGDNECGELRAMREDAEREARLEAEQYEDWVKEQRAEFEAQQADPMRAVCPQDFACSDVRFPLLCGVIADDDCPF